MTYTVRIVPNDRQFIIHSGETVLDAALNQQIAFPHRCRIAPVPLAYVSWLKVRWSMNSNRY